MSADVVNKVAARVLSAAILAMLVSCSAATSGTPAARNATAAAASHSYIVEAESTDKAASAVAAVGGEVVSRLGVIDAVEAKLTEDQHAKVLSVRGVKQITPNTPITTQAAASVRDNFETGSFANNDGTHRWYGDWVESNDNNSPYDGKVTIGWTDKGGKRLMIAGNGAIYRRAATPASSPSVTLKFKSSRGNLEWGEFAGVAARR